MPELRQDPVTQRWVVIATERAKRPHTFTRPPQAQPVEPIDCPFCPGHESETPPEVLAYREPASLPDSPGWRVRVVPNLYPAFIPGTADLAERVRGPYRALNAIGVHEVIISNPDHHRDVGELSSPEVRDIIAAYVERYLAHRHNTSLKYILIINNVGREAGASREHPHSQLLGIPLVPPALRQEITGLANYRAREGTCAYCDIIASELGSRERVIYENDEFLAFSPFASRVPFETCLIPRDHSPRFEEMQADEQRLFADALRAVAGRLTSRLNKPPLNYFIHTAPCNGEPDVDYHWHLELLPKLSIAAGFELGTEIMINTVLPEQAAEFLRDI